MIIPQMGQARERISAVMTSVIADPGLLVKATASPDYGRQG